MFVKREISIQFLSLKWLSGSFFCSFLWPYSCGDTYVKFIFILYDSCKCYWDFGHLIYLTLSRLQIYSTIIKLNNYWIRLYTLNFESSLYTYHRYGRRDQVKYISIQFQWAIIYMLNILCHFTCKCKKT